SRSGLLTVNTNSVVPPDVVTYSLLVISCASLIGICTYTTFFSSYTSSRSTSTSLKYIDLIEARLVPWIAIQSPIFPSTMVLSIFLMVVTFETDGTPILISSFLQETKKKTPSSSAKDICLIYLFSIVLKFC